MAVPHPTTYSQWDGAWHDLAPASVATLPADTAPGALYLLTATDGLRGPGLYSASGGAVTITASATPQAKAVANGVNAGTLAVGISKATATDAAIVTALLDTSGHSFHAGSLTVLGAQRTPAAGHSADAEAGGSSGGLIGVAASDAHALGLT